MAGEWDELDHIMHQRRDAESKAKVTADQTAQAKAVAENDCMGVLANQFHPILGRIKAKLESQGFGVELAGPRRTALELTFAVWAGTQSGDPLGRLTLTCRLGMTTAELTEEVHGNRSGTRETIAAAGLQSRVMRFLERAMKV